MAKTIPELSQYFSAMGKKGGKARADKLDPKRRKEIALKATRARWEKAKKESQ